MRRYLKKFLLPFYTFSLSEEIRNKLNPYKKLYPGHQDNLSPELDSLSPQPQHDYTSETYDSMFQSEMYQLPEEQQEENLGLFSKTNIFSSQFDNSNLNPEPLEEEQMELLTSEQEIENAIDMAAQNPDAGIVMEESNLLNDQLSLDGIINPEEQNFSNNPDGLEDILNDPIMKNALDEMGIHPYQLLNNQFLFDPLFFNGYMFWKWGLVWTST